MKLKFTKMHGAGNDFIVLNGYRQAIELSPEQFRFIADRRFGIGADQILIVEPHEIDALEIEPGQDYCTLITCTPYGINTHRLLVRGHRVENQAEAKTVRVTADAMQIEPVLVAPAVAAPMLLLLLIWVLVSDHKKKKR